MTSIVLIKKAKFKVGTETKFIVFCSILASYPIKAMSMHITFYFISFVAKDFQEGTMHI